MCAYALVGTAMGKHFNTCTHIPHRACNKYVFKIYVQGCRGKHEFAKREKEIHTRRE